LSFPRAIPVLFSRHLLRDALRHPVLAVLNILSLALGTAVYLAIQTANHSAERSFSAGIDLVAGKSHLEARGAVTDEMFPLLAKHPLVASATPTVEGVVTLADRPGEFLQIVGVDVLTNAAFRTFELRDMEGANFNPEPWLAQPGNIAITKAFAERLGLAPGSELSVMANGTRQTVRVGFIMDLTDSPAETNSRFAAMDIGWAQELFGKAGVLSSVQMILKNPQMGEQAAEALSLVVSGGVTMAPPMQRSFQIQKMLGAFRLNLTALSMVAMLVGMFLVYNTVAASVVRRRRDIGILRAMGVTRGEVQGLFLCEALVFGAFGALLGVAGGVLLAQTLTGSVAQTISSLYVLVSIDRSHFDPLQALIAVSLSMGAALVAAWVPSAAATRVDPVQVLHPGNMQDHLARPSRKWPALGILCFGISAACGGLALRGGLPLAGFGSAFFVLFGFALFSPTLLSLFSMLATRVLPQSWIVLRLAAQNLVRAVWRNAVTLAALISAVAMLTSVTVMIHSFRITVDTWIGRSVVADLYIAPVGNEVIGTNAVLPEKSIAWWRSQPGVDAVDTFREVIATINGAPASLGVVAGSNRRNLKFLDVNADVAMRDFFEKGDVLVSESYARKNKTRRGDKLRIASPAGDLDFRVAGTFSDYTRDQGVVMMDRETFERSWPDRTINSLGIYLKEGSAAAELEAGFRAAFGEQGEFLVYSQKTLRQRILAIFDQTFAVTGVLRVIAIAVAVLGVLLSLTSLVLERQREIGVLRSAGASRGQIATLFLAEGGCIGILASVAGLVAGGALALVLTFVINPAFFGWTIGLAIPWQRLLWTPLWLVPVSVLAALWPAWKASCVPPAQAVRME